MTVVIERQGKPHEKVQSGESFVLCNGSLGDVVLPGRASKIQVEVGDNSATLSTLKEHVKGFWETISCYRTPRFDVEETQYLEPGVPVLLPRKKLSGAIEFIQITNKP